MLTGTRGSSRRAGRRRAAGEDGSTLLMYPFAILIVFFLGSIAIDSAIMFQAHRQAVDVAAGLATDIAGVVDEGAFATSGTVRIDGDRAASVLAFTNDVELADHPNGLQCAARVLPAGDAVDVECVGVADGLLLPGAGVTLTGTARARADER